eukprot:CAMPEP_0182892280 /NCGR_PEP_ID=MMETSP0034_2-20130328/23784_1 /TAXON_ID=156128 /ORGANISM="Nephroselmis pyriformis, Strain CCMP717" /LENGTH=107 /DNA_ID=CAMNT_0025025951 /DNA_START=131 /DNA_END=451 /DNA_ORIENTATION=+
MFKSMRSSRSRGTTTTADKKVSTQAVNFREEGTAWNIVESGTLEQLQRLFPPDCLYSLQWQEARRKWKDAQEKVTGSHASSLERGDTAAAAAAAAATSPQAEPAEAP